MEVMIKKYINIPLWFRDYVRKPFGLFTPKHLVKVSNRFMEEEKIIYTDKLEFSDESYNAAPCVPFEGYFKEECACCDMRVTRYLHKDSEAGYP